MKILAKFSRYFPAFILICLGTSVCLASIISLYQLHQEKATLYAKERTRLIVRTEAFLQKEQDLQLELESLKKENQLLAEKIAEKESKTSLLKSRVQPTSPQVLGNVSTDNKPPVSGYRKQRVKIDSGILTVDIVAADLNSTRVIVDTASESDCTDNCLVLSLSDYVVRNSAFAAVNGSYFCPATYPQCASKKNSFDTLLMNKNKRYFNSDNNVYSVVPAAIFSGNSARFVTQSLEWGRDTSVDAVIANHPLLILNSQIFFGGDSDPKHNNKGGRSFIGVAGNTVYIGVVRNATVLESAKVLHALGLNHALNLDDGGSTALWYSGYKAGPGRNIPNAILFIKK